MSSIPPDGVDELLESIEPDDPAGSVTGIYDLRFFKEMEAVEPPSKSAHEHLDDARIGLSLFLAEAKEALGSTGLTTEQRVHISTIASYVAGLADRFDVVKRPGFGHR